MEETELRLRIKHPIRKERIIEAIKEIENQMRTGMRILPASLFLQFDSIRESLRDLLAIRELSERETKQEKEKE